MSYECSDSSGRSEVSLDEERPQVEVWAVTISPRLRRLTFGHCLYIDLVQYRHYISNGQLVVRPEFATNGRLHYHCIFYPKNYKVDYEFWAIRQGLTRAGFVLKGIKTIKSGITGKVSRRYTTLAKGVYSCMNFIKFLRVDEREWNDYCVKESERTKKILGFDVLTAEIWHDIEKEFKDTSKLDCVFND